MSEQPEPLSKNQIKRIRSRIAEIEELIAAMDDDAEKVMAEMARPEIASDFPRLRALAARQEEIQRNSRGLYDEWERLAAQIEGM